MPIGVFGRKSRVWVEVGRWTVPGMMLLAYMLLVYTANVGPKITLWISGGFAFVLLLWLVFRREMQRAAIARSAAVGDADRVLELAEAGLRRARTPAVRARYEMYRALAYDARRDWPAALVALDRAQLDALPPHEQPTWKIFAAAVRVAAFVETGRLAEARTLLDRELSGIGRGQAPRFAAHAHVLARLAHGRVLAAEGDADAALEWLQHVIDDIRAADGARGVAQRLRAELLARPARDAAARS